MNEREQRIRALEAEMLTMIGIVAEVFRHLAEISPQHDAAVRDGFDTVFRTLSQARDNTANADDAEHVRLCAEEHRVAHAVGACAERGRQGARHGAVRRLRTRSRFPEGGACPLPSQGCW